MSQELNAKMLALIGVDRLHALGHKGKGIKIMILDNMSDPEEHGIIVRDSMLVSCPDGQIFLTENGDEAWEKAIAEKYDMVHVSMTAFSLDLSKKFAENGGVVTASSGNKGMTDSQCKFRYWDWVIDIGACRLDADGSVKFDSVTKLNEDMDLSCFTPARQASNGSWFIPMGTSFSSPMGAGAIACLLQYWKHIGYAYTYKSVKDYLIKNAVDILEEGKDSQSGYGYIRVGLMKKIELEINGKAFIDGVEVPIDVPAQIIKGRTLVPVRFLSESLGCTLQFEQQAGKPVSKVIIFQDV